MFDISGADPSQRLFGKLSLAAIFLATVAVIGWPLGGHLAGETARGNLAYGLIVGSVLMDAAQLLGIGATSAIQRMLKVWWIAYAVFVCGFSIYLINLNDPEAFKAADTVLLIVMGILSFPMGIVAFAFVFFYSSVFLAATQTSAMDLIAFWTMLFVAGYAQWFLLMPALLRRLGARRRAQAQGT